MEFTRWLIRRVPRDSRLFVQVVPTRAVGRSGTWFEPDDGQPLHNSEPPDEVWTGAMLSAGIEKKLTRAGRFFADLDIRPQAGGSADVYLRIVGPDGSLHAERAASGVSVSSEFAIFAYVD